MAGSSAYIRFDCIMEMFHLLDLCKAKHHCISLKRFQALMDVDDSCVNGGGSGGVCGVSCLVVHQNVYENTKSCLSERNNSKKSIEEKKLRGVLCKMGVVVGFSLILHHKSQCNYLC